MSEGNGKINGQVKWYNESKGYGFITVPGNRKDVFVHANELQRCGITRPLKEGEAISFVVSDRPKGAYATEITLGV